MALSTRVSEVRNMSTAKPENRIRRACLRIAIGILLFLAADSAIFRSGFYLPWIAPASGLGSMMRAVQGIKSIPVGHRSVLVLGDSRIAEGFSAKLATEQAKALGSSLTFTSGGVPGTLPRVWYYLLREVSRPSERLAAVAMMTTSYHDDDPEPQADRRADIVFVHPLLQFKDLLEFPTSFPSRRAKLDAVEAILFSGLFYKSDMQDFLLDPMDRVREATAWRKHGQEWIKNYSGRESSLIGLNFNIDSGKLIIAPSHPPPQPDALASYADSLHFNHGRLPSNALAVTYRDEWIGRIADFCQSAGIKLIVFRIPRGPLHYMVDADEQPTGVIASLADAGKLELLPATTFDALEQPKFFFDNLHLNAAGRRSFSDELAKAISQSVK